MIRQLLTLVLLSSALSACGLLGGGSSGDGGKKIFRYNQTGGLSSLDPAFARNRANIWATTQIYNGLVSLNKSLDVVNELADSYKISEDGKTYTFFIRKGVRFHDNPCFSSGRGREVVAEDFVYTFKRILDKNTASTGSWILSDKVLRDAKGEVSDTCFVAVNDTTLRIHLRERSSIFINVLAMPYAFVVPKEAIEKYGKEFRSNPVGTGPFMIKKWVEKQSLVLEKNPNYWKKDASGNHLPYLDGIQVSFIEDPNQAYITFTDGNLDFLTGITGNSRDQILDKQTGKIKEQFKSKFEVDKVPYLLTEYVGFLLEGDDEKKNPFLNKKVRQALSYATNRQGITDFIRNKLGFPGNFGFIPNALPSFDTSRVKGYKFDLKKAQELLKEAGYPNGKGFPEITLYTYSSDKEVADNLQKRWQDIGIKVNIQTNQFATHQELVDNGKANFFRGSWIGDYPDAENFLKLFYGKKENFAPAGPNKTHYSNAEFDKLYDQALKIDDNSNRFSRYDLYSKMDSLMIADAPIIVLYYDEVIQLRQKRIKNLEANAMNILLLENVDIKDPNEATAEKK